MFRKPKKKPAALRGGPSGSGGTINNTASTNNKRRRRASSSSEDEDNNDGNEEGTSDLLQQIRQERDDAKSSKSGDNKKLLNTSSTASSSSKKMKMHQYKSNDVQLSAQEQATRTGEYHPTSDKQSANNGDDNNNDDAAAAASSQNAQIAALQKQTRNKFLAGPIKATTFVRTTTRFDYQPDICKDYKETGFCGFGDTCIYLHDRGDTKSGWQMEQEYEEKKKREEEKKGKEMEAFMQSMMCGEVGTTAGDGGLTATTGGGNGKDDKSFNTDDGIPFACHICRGPFNSPIVTTCGHYFCEKCMQSRVREVGSGCPICQKDTHGVLNYAQKLVAKKRRLVGRDGTWEEYLERSKKGSDGDGDE